MTLPELTRRKWMKIVAGGLALLAGLHMASASGEAGPREAFCIVALPDTQLYAASHPEIFLSQTEWIKENRDSLNIAFVVHEGDITNDNSEAQWRNADRAMRVLDGVVPYCLAVGNHDMKIGGETRETELFNKFFPVSRFEEAPWYKGHFEEDNDNSYCFFTACGLEFLVVALEFGPTDEMLAWANRIIAEHKDRRVIVVTHSYMYSDDTRVGDGDSWNPHGYSTTANDGEEMWEKLVKKHENIFLVLSGHILNDGLGKLTSTGEHGNRVHQVLANYQMKENGGNGWLRIMRFVPDESKIYVTTYSPYLKQYATDDQNQFELRYRMK